MELVALNVDITTLEVDAIVNAANPVMRGGGGVDGAIHRAAGYKLARDCAEEYPHGCATGQVRLTKGHDLPAKYVIHTVGPDMREVLSQGLGDRLLASCYYQAMMMAENMDFRTIAFPAISTGVYGFDKESAAIIAVESVIECHGARDMVSQTLEYDVNVTFACFGEEDTEILQIAIDRWKV